ncbi:hypothetical protein Lesp02_39940 [Lentzea sp. NBRC 105346]|uniref:WXG100 family type VII secretion target n=1 Tax=Lentzea sp. NBRC 105346 TaxID=3032205 RepID=UPI0024A3B3F4|nr:hypothetical protein [Lentzea sp. NBRC 105346]GLZ31806.1 hypothetical protein Lesp02_39940 [Lentzea sp. NBRC 105346]
MNEIEDLASAALAPVAGTPVQPLVDLLRNVWEGYFGAPVPPGTTNWNAYTHEQLHEMLWQDADVGDVSDVAAEWGRHGTELTGHADALRTQREALGENWGGRASEQAGTGLDRLGERTTGIATRADTIGKAAQDAGDALALARNTMPPPPGDSTALVAAGTAAGAGVGAAIGAVAGAGAGGVGAGPGALMGAAIGALVGGAGSAFLANAAAAGQKAEAVHVMQRYEASLAEASHAVTPGAPGAARTFGSAADTTSVSGFAGSGGGAAGGVPWQRLANPLEAKGMATGVLGTTPFSATVMPAGTAGRAANGMAAGGAPGGARREGEQDAEHRSRMPVADHGLFDVDERVCTPVIGL